MQRESLVTRRIRTLAGASFALIGFAVANWPSSAQAQSSAGVRAVPTYEAAGLYWSNPGASSATGCEVKFRRVGDSAWTQGLAMWFDARASECRGSLVNLVPGASYEAQLNLPGQAAARAITFTTWANSLPVARVVTVSSGSGTLNITEGGSASGYVVYQGAAGATLDAQNGSQFNVSVNASYVIVRGLILRGAQQDAVRISPNVHDVVIEDNDISGWGRTRDGRWGTDMDSAVRAHCSSPTLTRVTIQRNKMHDPRYSANSWADGHPEGPQAISFGYCGGNHVFRWNEIYSTNGNYFNDIMGGEDNFSDTGFPNSDTDIYGNKLSHAWDDAIEAEGANKNVRIWGNYIDRTAIGIATTVTATGPVYIFRNVWNRSKFFANRSNDTDDRQPFFKSGSSSDFGNGRRYLFHNTMLQASEAGSSYGLGGGAGIGGTGNSQLINNTISMNNIYHLWKPNSAFYQVGIDNVFQNDMYNGNSGAAIVSGIHATPSYAAGHGWQSESGGQYALAAGTPGYNAGVRIANFNDGFSGAAPDVGAAEAGAGAMKFGLAAAGAVSTPTPPPNPTPPPTPPPPPAPPPTPGPIGSASPSLGLDSSSYSILAGQSVSFTVTVSGSSGAPTGTLAFTANSVAIAGCQSVAVSGGKGTCTTSSLTSGAHAIRAVYSGNATYSNGLAGPITQTVSGPAATPAPGGNAVNVQGLWWKSTESGWGVNLTQQGDLLFATWFTYDTDGSGLWLVMSEGVKTGTSSWSGTLYRTSGPAYNLANFDAKSVVRTAVGTASFSFSDANNGTFAATVNGSTISKTITRTAFGASMPTCTLGGNSGAASNFQDLWWRSAGTESGWGVNVTHQGDTIFMTWFTYDTAGRGLWLVASDVRKTSHNSYSGTLYRTYGQPFNAPSWNPDAVTRQAIGLVTFDFTDGANGWFTYTIDGNTQSKPISRLVFSSPASVCR